MYFPRESENTTASGQARAGKTELDDKGGSKQEHEKKNKRMNMLSCQPLGNVGAERGSSCGAMILIVW